MKSKRELWLEKKSRKRIEIITKRNRRHKKAVKNRPENRKTPHTITKNGSGSYKTFAPANFSITDNPEEVIHFFNNIVKLLSHSERRMNIFFDLSKVEKISNDALMYLLAIIKNFKAKPGYTYSFSGNNSNTAEVSRIVKESGFFNYVKSQKDELIKTDNKIMIRTGCNSDGKLARELCEFVQDKFGHSKNLTTMLYQTCIELMSNTYHHAYNDNGSCLIEKVWYMYAEYYENKIRIIFLDTGEGIATTVNKKIHEKIDDFLRNTRNINSKDSDYVMSALLGDPRTETKQLHRGGGLPEIYGYSQCGYLKNLLIITGRGFCRIDNKSHDKLELKEKLTGTLFSWEITNASVKERLS